MMKLKWQEYDSMHDTNTDMSTKNMIEEMKQFIESDPDIKFKKTSQNGYEFRLLDNPEDLLKSSLTTYERDILELADEMASSMTDLNAHNYKNFVDARDKFRDKIKEMCDKTMENHKRVERMKKAVAEI